MEAGRVIEVVERYLVDQHDGRVQQRSKDALVVDIGSRVLFRMFGVFTSALPAKLAVRVEAAGEVTHVDVELASDQGWYLTGLLPMAQRNYRDRFDQIAAGLLDRVDGEAQEDLPPTDRPASEYLDCF